MMIQHAQQHKGMDIDVRHWEQLCSSGGITGTTHSANGKDSSGRSSGATSRGGVEEKGGRTPVGGGEQIVSECGGHGVLGVCGAELVVGKRETAGRSGLVSTPDRQRQRLFMSLF
jgi:hypothetical protein